MQDTSTRTADGKVLWHFSMSLDGFVAGPNDDMSWLFQGVTGREGLVDEYVRTTGAIIGGRRGWDASLEYDWRPYGGAWEGPLFILTHHPEDAAPVDGVTFLHCDLHEAVRIARGAAGNKNVEVLSPSIGKQMLDLGLIDEIDLHIAPVLLGDGVRLYDNRGGEPLYVRHVEHPDPTAEINVRVTPQY